MEKSNKVWNHRTVFDALAQRGEKLKKSSKNSYVCLYQQSPLCAVLYSVESSTTYRNAPVHINDGRDSWSSGVWMRIRPSLAPQPAHVDKKGPGKESSNFAHYEVLDWAAFAEALGLN